jgi:cytidylate kinase
MMMSFPLTIAIDGPAASGKSTIGALLAERLGYVYFDTGVMYRAVTWAALQRGIPIEDESTVTRLSEDLHIEVTKPTEDDGRQYTVCADGEDVTWDLRRPEVNQHVSPVSAYAGVRASLVAQQRRIGLAGSIVMVGRDIGTHVLPQAGLKIYLEAVVDERAWRRHAEVVGRHTSEQLGRARERDAEYESILEALIRRDRIDSSRKVSPLRPADDAQVIDTSEMTVDQVLDRVLELAREKGGV